MSKEIEELELEKEWAIVHKYLTKSSIIVFSCFISVLLVLFIFKISSAAVATGQVVIDFNKKTIQHLEGGIIKDILVKNGDEVKKGQSLIKLLDSQGSENLKASKFEYENLQVEVERIKSQIEDKSISRESLNKQYSNKVVDLQMSIMASEKNALQDNINSIKNNIEESKLKFSSHQKQHKILQEKLLLLKKEKQVVENLYETNNATRSKLLETIRQLQEAELSLINNNTEIEKELNNQKELNIKLQSVRTEYQTNLQNKLSDDLKRLSEAEKQYNNQREFNDRLNVIAPVDGIVRNMQVFTIGGVLKPGQDLMDIVPKNDEMLIEVKIDVKDIDVVQKDQEVMVNFSALQSKITPRLNGRLVYIDPEVTKEQNGKLFYIGRIKVEKGEQKKIANLKLHSGMQVEAFIVVDKKSFATILFAPLLQQISKSFRDA